MKIKFLISLIITILLVLALNRSWNIKGSPIPPLGKFLDPFHGFWSNAEDGHSNDKELTLPGLKDEVTVVYDSIGIPHIFAKNDDDLYYAQGYVTAKDRLWQMEFQTHAGAGRISEIIGAAALDFDRDQRRMGMVMAAERSLQKMESNPIAKAMADHYTMGINAWIESLNYERLPIEYKLLGYEPEPWTNLKAALLLVNMAKTLNVGEKDLAMTNALKLFGKETLDILFPDQENVGDPIVDNAGNWKFKPITLDSVPLAIPDELIHLPVQKFNHDIGSNNWAVSGSKTATGSPMLCNDPHLNLSLPSIWYVIHLNAPGINAMGASLPGSPAVISGFNDSIAWGETNAQRDVVDWYRIQFKDKKKNEYFSDGKWKPTHKVIERFTIKSGADFFDTVVYTHHGPVRYDESYHAESESSQLAYRWITHEPGLELLTFNLLNRAKNHSDYMKALDNYSSPAQNFVFASVSGDIAMRIQGKYPVRRKDEGKFILDGTKTSQEWQAFIPYDQNVMYKNPARGFISSANQYPVDATYPYYVNADSYEAYRNRRINRVLGELQNITTKDLMNLQLDTYNIKASESLPLFLSYLDSTSLSPVELDAFHKLKSWDYNNTIHSEGTSYYTTWWNSFYAMIWDRLLTSKVTLDVPTDYTTIKLIKERPDFAMFDLESTPEKENAGDIVRKSFSEALKKIAKWKAAHPTATKAEWAEYKDTYVGHLMRLPAFSYHVEHGGGSGVVDASGHTHGPSWRMVVSLEKTGVKAWGVYPGGQSGNPGSPFYNNLLSAWAQGEYFKLHFTHSIDELKHCTMVTTKLKKQ